MGIGGLPDTVVKLLKESGYKNLGVHTEMMGDGTLELIEEGVVTNDQKKLDRGKSVFTFCLGSLKLYEYLLQTIQRHWRDSQTKKAGRPKKELSEEEIKAIEEAYEEYRCNAIVKKY